MLERTLEIKDIINIEVHLVDIYILCMYIVGTFWHHLYCTLCMHNDIVHEFNYSCLHTLHTLTLLHERTTVWAIYVVGIFQHHSYTVKQQWNTAWTETQMTANSTPSVTQKTHCMIVWSMYVAAVSDIYKITPYSVNTLHNVLNDKPAGMTCVRLG